MKKIALLTAFGVTSAFAQAVDNGLVIQVYDANDLASVIADHGAPASEQAGSSPFAIVAVPEGTSLSAYEAELRADPRVRFAEESQDQEYPEQQSSRGSTIAAVFDPHAVFAANNNVWGQIRFNPTNELRARRGIRIAIVDTGLSPNQSVLWTHVERTWSFVHNSPFVADLPTGIDTNNNGETDEATGHGTMITGILSQMCPDASLTIIQMANSDGMATSWNALKSIVYAVENQCKLINFSFGAVGDLEAMERVSDWAFAHGSLIVAPSGNMAYHRALAPSKYDHVVCVTGLLPTGVRAPFSNWDSGADVSAPATGIESAWWTGESAVWSGTSFSAPLVTGALANAMERTPSRSLTSLMYRLERSGKDIDPLNPGYQGKLGRALDYQSLVRALGGTPLR